MDKTTAIRMYESKWWTKEPHNVCALTQLNTELLVMPFELFHEYVQELLGRPVWTHEFADPKSLIEEYQGLIPRADFEQVLNKIPSNIPVIVALVEDVK